MLARCVDSPEPVPGWCELLLDRGPYGVQGELELLRERRVDVLVTKDSGGSMTSAKLEAARVLGIPVVVIRRPALPAGVAVVETVDQVVDWLRERR
jgi:precorrin-6A/cobalt-precorrin-6A reductase